MLPTCLVTYRTIYYIGQGPIGNDGTVRQDKGGPEVRGSYPASASADAVTPGSQSSSDPGPTSATPEHSSFPTCKSWLHQVSIVAQVVEHWPMDQEVMGSNLAERLTSAHLNSSKMS